MCGRVAHHLGNLGQRGVHRRSVRTAPLGDVVLAPPTAAERPGHGPSPYNEVTLDDDGRVTRFREKPKDPQTDLVAVALYFFPPFLVDDLSAYLASGGISDAPGHFIAWLVQQRSVFALPLTGEWFDIGSLEALEQARLSFGVPAR